MSDEWCTFLSGIVFGFTVGMCGGGIASVAFLETYRVEALDTSGSVASSWEMRVHQRDHKLDFVPSDWTLRLRRVE